MDSSKPDSIKADACNELALVFRDKSEMDSAGFYAERALKLSKNAAYLKGEAIAHYNLGIVASTRGDYVKALDHFYKAAEIDKTIGDKKSYASVLSAIGGQKMYIGDLTGALDFHLQALKIKEEIGDSTVMASTLSNIGSVYRASGDGKKALEYFQRSLRLNLKYHKMSRVMTDYYNVANVLQTEKKDSLALFYAERSAALADSLGNPETLSYAYDIAGLIKKKQGKLEESKEYYNRALAIAEKIQDKRMIAYQYTYLGSVYDLLGNRKQAEENYLQAFAIAGEINSKENLVEIHKSMSELYEHTGDQTKALYHFKRYIGLRDSIINEEKETELMKKEMNFNFVKERLADSLVNTGLQKEKDSQLQQEKSKRNYLIGGLALMLLLTVITMYAFVSKRKANIIISQQKEMVEDKQKEITDSINYAKRIQYSLLAQDELLKTNLPDYFILFKPKDIVSGDFYWATKKGTSFYLACCDSTGHGVPGAFMSLLNISYLNEAINEKNIQRPDEILNYVRQRLIENMEGGQDGMDATLVRFDNNTLSYASAHNKPILIRNGELNELSADKMPVGKSDNMNSFSLQNIKTEKGDLFYFFTDGYADQFGGVKGKKFKYSQLKEKLTEINSKPFNQQKNILEETFADWRGDLEQVDDVLIIGVKIS